MTTIFDTINKHMLPKVYGKQLIPPKGKKATSHLSVESWPVGDYYVINFYGVPEAKLVSQAVKAHQEINPDLKIKNVVCIYEFECQHTFFWTAVIDYLKTIGYHSVLVIDGGFDLFTNFIDPYPNVFHAQSPFFFSVYDNTPITFDSVRKHHFVCLTRRMKASRLRISVALLERGLQQNGLISCGWSKEDSDMWDPKHQKAKYTELIPIRFREMFPLDLGHKDSDQWKVVDLGLHDSVFNVVVETHTGNWGLTKHNLHETFSDRPHFTEKTTKCFAFYQIPIILGTYKQVAKLRSLNFDMFDDVVDHSYDDEPDIIRREQMVADELKRLCETSLEEWAEYLEKNQLRFIKNKHQLLVACHHNKSKIEKILTKFNND